ncbi:hypothetical protein ERX37_07965 [Macrococcus hajekii]|uniref:Uncharacterized protein n=1 Tax=Macrococcus hajekii TaxID=198482 RepID=A0A4R6BIL9_9STAP|nr:hypothetical protein [Macrococcus hajekii]TDM01428.1 hypothetical protein ERX37_07965 [Macrococcus hajekii]GGA99896.1 hypothetical protein GCM10007190_04930 [Macrococcus hajekii]
MKINEFIELVKILDNKLTVMNESKIKVKYNGVTVMYIGPNQHQFNNDFSNFQSLGPILKENLFNLGRDLAATPPLERIDEKKYSLKLCEVFGGNNKEYINLDLINNRYMFNNKSQTHSFITSFTKSEIDMMPDEIRTMISYKILIPELVR